MPKWIYVRYELCVLFYVVIYQLFFGMWHALEKFQDISQENNGTIKSAYKCVNHFLPYSLPFFIYTQKAHEPSIKTSRERASEKEKKMKKKYNENLSMA